MRIVVSLYSYDLFVGVCAIVFFFALGEDGEVFLGDEKLTILHHDCLPRSISATTDGSLEARNQPSAAARVILSWRLCGFEVSLWVYMYKMLLQLL